MELIQTKVCGKCSKTLPATLEFFYKHGSGLFSICKECKKQSSQINHEKNKERIHERKRLYRINNWEKIRKQERFYRERTKDRAYLLNKIHNWVRYHKPKQEGCTICYKIKKLELANISGDYSKDIDDYLWLCKKCHIQFDKDNNTHEKYLKEKDDD